MSDLVNSNLLNNVDEIAHLKTDLWIRNRDANLVDGLVQHDHI